MSNTTVATSQTQRRLLRTLWLPLLATTLLLGGCVHPARPLPQEPERPIAAAQELHGEHTGAPWRIDVPTGWNGSLVMLLHGYEPVGTPRQTPLPINPLAPVFLERGYAVAFSAYRSQGWAVAEALEDNAALRREFIARFGHPRRSYLAGLSMGGHLALASMELHPADYDGALSLCGVNAPASELFTDGGLLPLAATEVLFPGALGLPDGDIFASDGPSQLNPERLGAALAADPVRTQRLAQRLQVPAEGLPGALWLHYLVLREVADRAGGIPVDNRQIRYQGFTDDAAFNARVRRYQGDPQALAYVRQNYTLSGDIHKPVLLLSNSVDPTVPARLGQRYLELAAARGNSDWLVDLPAVGDGHCWFTQEQVAAAFAALTGWVEHGRRP